MELDPRIKEIRDYYVKRRNTREDTLAAGLGMAGEWLDQMDDIDHLPEPLKEAFRLAFPSMTESDIEHLGEAGKAGVLQAWKGKLFEVMVRDQLNAGVPVGELRLAVGEKAVLAESLNEPGWDLRILDWRGVETGKYQLKATVSEEHVRESLQRYPDFRIIATDDVSMEDILPGGHTNSSLAGQVSDAIDDLAAHDLQDILGDLLPYLPFILIIGSEGLRAAIGRKPLVRAFVDAGVRGAKCLSARTVGFLVLSIGLGPLSIPASMATRYGIDRALWTFREKALLRQKTEEIRGLPKFRRSP